MTIEDLYYKIKTSPELLEKNALLNVYALTYEAWLSHPNSSSFLVGIYKILKGLDKNHNELLKNLCSGVDFNALGLPESIAEPEWLLLRREALERQSIDMGGVNDIAHLTTLDIDKIKQAKYLAQLGETPSLKAQAKNFVSSMKDFAASGFKTTTAEQYAARRKICETCIFFDPAGFAGIGKCRKCGCSAYKLNVAAARCPMHFWGAVE
jgi:hypothetical protein